VQLSLRLSFHLRHSLRDYTVGTTTGFWVETVEALALHTSLPNPIEVHAVANEHLSCFPLRGHFFVTLSNGRHEGYCQSKIPQYHKTLITACGYDAVHSLQW
jgi:hypothetical protein